MLQAIALLFIQQDLEDNYTAIVSMLDTGAKVKIDQAHLETVIPAIGIKYYN